MAYILVRHGVEKGQEVTIGIANREQKRAYGTFVLASGSR